MDQDLKNKIAEIVELVITVPANLQEKCFEVLLSHYLAKGGETKKKVSPTTEETETGTADIQTGLKAGEDLQQTDLHVKARKFLEKQGLMIDHLNQLFYKEADEVKPLYEDLKTTKTAESQIRIALLLALHNGITTGEFTFNGETVREECRVRKCYDGANFSKNFKNKAALFEGFEKYDKGSPGIKLSDSGRKELAELIKILQ